MPEAKSAASSIAVDKPSDSVKNLSLSHQGPVTAQWIAAIQTDAFGDRLIFEHLSTTEPLKSILKKGIVSFERKTLRTPDYRAEEGYDLLIYEIRHPLSGVSRVMAYFEKDGEAKTLKIVFLTGRMGETSVDLVEFNGDLLASQRQVSLNDAQILFDHELRDASTLMSASIR